MNKGVVTRFAPSPTGKAHAGSYRTAMYEWLFARHNGGKFILRIEDTDTARNDKESELDIYEALEWLGLNYDEKFIQSDNLPRHRELLQKLIGEDKAYISKEEAKDGSGVIKDIVRFRNPKKVVTFVDLIRGEISTDTTDLGDFVIARNIEEPLFHLAVVVDDHDEGVTHVIRAEEHIANTPRQILIHEALGFEIPEYAHLPIVLGSDKQKLSKRKGAWPMTTYAGMGYLKDAVFNCIAMIGWNPADPGSDQEIFSVDELVKRFDFGRVQKSSAVFNLEKLNWFNKEYLNKLSDQEFLEYLEPAMAMVRTQNGFNEDTFRRAIPVVRERIMVRSEFVEMFEKGELNYLWKDPMISSRKAAWKDCSPEVTRVHIETLSEMLGAHSEGWDVESLRALVMPYAEKNGKGDVLWPLRYILTGLEKSPDPFTVMEILGRDETVHRMNTAMEY